MKQLYISAQYFYVLNQITIGEDSQAICAPSAPTKREYLTEIIDGEIFDINKLEMNEMNSTKSIVAKRVRL